MANDTRRKMKMEQRIVTTILLTLLVVVFALVSSAVIELLGKHKSFSGALWIISIVAFIFYELTEYGD